MSTFDSIPGPESEESVLEANVKALSDSINITIRPGFKEGSLIGIAYAGVDSVSGKVKEILTTGYDDAGKCLYKIQWNFYRNPIGTDAPEEPLIASCRDVDISYFGGGVLPSEQAQRRIKMTGKLLNDLAIQYR
jgi:hypothetical protein